MCLVQEQLINIQMQPQCLQWMQKEARDRLLNDPQIQNYQSGDLKEIFTKVLRVLQKDHRRYIRKQYLGYATQPAPLDKLHPILHIFVRLEISQMQLLHRIKQAVDYSMNNPQQSVQRIYNYKQMWFEKDQYNVLFVTAQVYKFTLSNMISIVKEKKVKSLSKKFIEFLRAFLFRVYLSILFALSTPQASSLCLSYTIDLENIAFDQFYCLMLCNPMYGGNEINPLIAYQNNKMQRFIRGSIRTQIYEVFCQVVSSINLNQILEIEKDITCRIFKRKDQYVKLNDEIDLIQKVLKENPSLRFEFPTAQICNSLREIQMQLSNRDELARFHMEQLSRDNSCLIDRAKHHI